MWRNRGRRRLAIALGPVLWAAVVVVFSSGLCTWVSAAPAYTGFNFYASGKVCYLKDMNGNTLHTWTSTRNVMSHAYLLRDSSVLFPCEDNTDAGNGTWSGGMIALQGGRYQIIKWNGALAWDFPYHGTSYMPHHDCYPVYYTRDKNEMPSIFAVVATKESDGVIAEKIVEFKPTGATTADIKWEWRAYDHKISKGTDKPELLDSAKGYMDFTGPGATHMMTGKEWLHANHVRYNMQLDIVLVNLRYFGEFVLLDHSTTTAQAATHTGGKYGKGGDILYRWGNPANYGASGTNYLRQQHATNFVLNYMPGTKKALPGAGHVLVISNSDKKGYEIVLPSTNGVYPRTTGSAYGPTAPLWTLSIPNMSGNEGTIQRLPNGNTLISRGLNGNGIYEYDSTGTSVWTMNVSAAAFFRYDSAYLGSTLLDTGNASAVINGEPRPACLGIASAEYVSVNALPGKIRFDLSFREMAETNLEIFSISGKRVFGHSGKEKQIFWDTKGVPRGTYLSRTRCGSVVAKNRLSIM